MRDCRDDSFVDADGGEGAEEGVEMVAVEGVGEGTMLFVEAGEELTKRFCDKGVISSIRRSQEVDEERTRSVVTETSERFGLEQSRPRVRLILERRTIPRRISLFVVETRESTVVSASTIILRRRLDECSARVRLVRRRFRNVTIQLDFHLIPSLLLR